MEMVHHQAREHPAIIVVLPRQYFDGVCFVCDPICASFHEGLRPPKTI